MSFVSILKKIAGVAFTVEHIAAPIVETLVPGSGVIVGELDTITSRLQSAILTVEANDPTVGNGAQKATAVANDFVAGLGLAQAIAGATGHTVTWDQTALQKTIDAFVAAYNQAAALQATIKLVPPVPLVTKA